MLCISARPIFNPQSFLKTRCRNRTLRCTPRPCLATKQPEHPGNDSIESPRSSSSESIAGKRAYKPKFSSVEVATRYFKTKADWTGDDLDDSCLSRPAWLTLISSLPPEYEQKYEDRWYKRTCILISFGFTTSQALSFLSRRDSYYCTLRGRTTSAKVNWLQTELGWSRAEIVKVLSVHTRLLDYSLPTTLMSRSAFFREYFLLDGHQLGRVVLKHPRLLWAHVEYDVKVKVKILTGLIGDPIAVAGMLRKQPGLLALSELTIQDKIRRLVSELMLSPPQLKRILVTAPSLLMRNLNCLKETQDVLEDHGFAERDQLEMFTKYPQILTLSPETVRSKLTYLLKRANLQRSQLRSNPVLLGCSLRQRLVPRHRALVEHQALQPDQCPPVTAFLLTDIDFEKKFVPGWLGAGVDLSQSQSK